jgi:hypothetical protein
MDRAFLEQLGLEVSEAEGVVEAQLVLTSGQAINPLSRTPIDRVSFTVMGDRLLYVGPPEFIGAQPINLAFITSATRLEDLVITTLSDHLYQLERRSKELTTLGFAPKVDPLTLQLTADVEVGPVRVTIGPNRGGQFRVVRALYEGAELPLSHEGATSTFELSEFRDKRALEDFLFAMFSEALGVPAAPSPGLSRPSPTPGLPPELSISFRDLIHAFGDAVLPPRSPLEVLATVKVDGQQLRFAAARVQGQTFRGLLAGPTGKLWADRFELTDFRGIRALVAEVMNTAIENVEVHLP